MKNTLYTVQRIKKDGTFYGPIHSSYNGYISFCAVDFKDNSWYILTNDSKGLITCKRCIKISKK